MLAQVHRQTLILFKGHPGTGKSTLANALAKRLAWPLLDKDDIKDLIYQLPNSGYLSYEVLWKIVRHQLAIGLNIIVDSTLSYPQSYATGQQLAAEFGARLLLIETKLPDDLWKARLDQRLSEQQTHRTSGWEAMQQLLEEYADSWRYPIALEHHVVIQTDQPTETMVEAILIHIEKPA